MGQHDRARAHRVEPEHGAHHRHARADRAAGRRLFTNSSPQDAVSGIHDPVLARRERWVLGGIVVTPALFFLLVRLLGYMKYAKLGAAAVAALAGAAFLFVR